LVTGIISDEDTEKLWAAIEANPGVDATVDLENQTVSVGSLTVKFEIDEYTRWRLMEGLDDIGLTLRDEQAITDFEAKREAWRPKTLPAKG
jgi:3-isopropylmalate/(R)-2-methylmalate dehydratase small subunit